MASRRRFIQVGLVGGALLSAGGAWYAFSRHPAQDTPFSLDANAREIVAALLPAFVGRGQLEADSAAQIARRH